MVPENRELKGFYCIFDIEFCLGEESLLLIIWSVYFQKTSRPFLPILRWRRDPSDVSYKCPRYSSTSNVSLTRMSDREPFILKRRWDHYSHQNQFYYRRKIRRRRKSNPITCRLRFHNQSTPHISPSRKGTGIAPYWEYLCFQARSLVQVT